MAALIALYMAVFAAPSVVSYWHARSARACRIVRGAGHASGAASIGRGRPQPVVWRSLVGPIVSLVTVLTMFAFIGTDAILSMGD